MLERQATSDTAPFLRRIQYHDEASRRELVFLTNHPDLPALTTAAMYEERWHIELLFKVLKQNLRNKTFVGRTAKVEDADLVSIDSAAGGPASAMQSPFSWSLSRLIALLLLSIKIGPESVLLASDFEITAGQKATVKYATCKEELAALEWTDSNRRTVIHRQPDGTPAWN